MTTPPFTEQERAIAEFLATAWRMAKETRDWRWFCVEWPRLIKENADGLDAPRIVLQRARGPFVRIEARAMAQRDCLLAARDRRTVEWPPESSQIWVEVVACGACCGDIEALETAGFISIARAGGDLINSLATGDVRSYLVRPTALGAAIAQDMEAI